MLSEYKHLDSNSGVRILLVWLLILTGCPAAPPVTDTSFLQDENFRQAEKYFLEANYREAINYYQKFLKSHPAGPFQARVYYRLGICHLTEAKYDLALDLFKLGLERADDITLKGQIQAKIATTYMYKKDYPSAIRWYKKVLAGDTRHLPQDELLYYLAIALIRTGEWRKGYDYLQEVITLDPKSNYAEGARTILALPANTFVVQLGKYRHKEYALKDLEYFQRDKGIEASLEILTLEGKETYFIWAGRFSNWRRAKTKADEIMGLGVDAIVLP